MLLFCLAVMVLQCTRMTLTLALLESREQYLTRTTHYSYYGVIFATIPMLLAYVFLQRYLIEGMTAGSVKG